MFSCPPATLCSWSFLSEHYLSDHGIKGPNCAQHFTCKEALSEQKELFAGFCCCWILENAWSNWLGHSLITRLYSEEAESITATSECPQTLCGQRACGERAGPEGQYVCCQRESLPPPSGPSWWCWCHPLDLAFIPASSECLSAFLFPKMKPLPCWSNMFRSKGGPEIKLLSLPLRNEPLCTHPFWQKEHWIRRPEI